jgi:hypothetical protein
MNLWISIVMIILLGPCLKPAVGGDHRATVESTRPCALPETGCVVELFAQWPDQGFHGGWSMVHSDGDYGTRVAESFVFPATWSADRIRWWGGYESVLAPVECDVIPRDDFVVTIYLDDGGRPGNSPGQIVATYESGNRLVRKATGRMIPLAGIHQEFAYELAIEDSLTLRGGQRYWIEIINRARDFCAWSWETAPPGAYGDGFALWDSLGFGYAPFDFDLAMEVIRADSSCAILSSEPAHEAVDPRQPSTPSGRMTPSWSSIAISLEPRASTPVVGDFLVLGSGEPVPAVVAVESTPDGANVVLDGALMPGECMTIIYLPTGERLRLGFLPGDVDASATADGSDLAALMNLLAEEGAGPAFSCDINHDESCGPDDLLRLVDLLSGGGEYDPWWGTELPECP